jgi:tetratricopeptide (TPR) repeat protein
MHIEKGKAYQNLGAACFLRQDFKDGVNYYHQASIIAKDDAITLLRIYLGIGINFTLLECYRDAIKYEEMALSLAIKHNFTSEKVAIYNNLGRIYSHLGEYDLANDYYYSGVQIAIENEVWQKLGYLYVGLIRNELFRENYIAMEKLLLKMEETMETHSEIWFLGINKTLWALLYLHHDNLPLSKSNFDLGMSILKEEEQAHYIFIAYRDYLDSLIKLNHYPHANIYFYDFYQAIENYSIETGYPTYYKMKASFHSLQGDLKNFNAFNTAYQEKHKELCSIIKTYF